MLEMLRLPGSIAFLLKVTPSGHAQMLEIEGVRHLIRASVFMMTNS